MHGILIIAVQTHVEGRTEGCFSILRKCQGKYECLLYEMLYNNIKELSPSLNTQSDSIRSKLYT